ncbi:MAG: hypothetical protein V3U03_09650 [Myxococcota bacterium]
MTHPFRRKNLAPRLLPCYLLALVAFAFADPSPLGCAVGGILVGVGAALRCWGAGHLVKTERLIVSGPYAHQRHPLYAGTLLLGVGFAALAGGWGGAVAAACFVPFFFLYYLPYKERIEGARLERRYGGAYTAYRAAVPALIPSPVRWASPAGSLQGAGAGRWSRVRFRENGELGTLIGVGVATALLAFRPLLAP